MPEMMIASKAMPGRTLLAAGRWAAVGWGFGDCSSMKAIVPVRQHLKSPLGALNAGRAKFGTQVAGDVLRCCDQAMTPRLVERFAPGRRFSLTGTSPRLKMSSTCG